MNKTVTISTFAGILSRQSGYTSEFCEHFVAEMFRTVADALKDNEEISIKGLGRFAVDDNGNVSFVPDDSFASEANAPFDCFEPEPLDDYVTEELLDKVELDKDEEDSTEEVESEAVVVTTESEVVSEIAPEEAEPIAEETVGTEVVTEVMAETLPETEEDVASEIVSETPATEDDDVYPREEAKEAPARRGRVWPFVCGVALGAVLGAAVTYFIVAKAPSSETGEQIAAEEQLVAEDFGEIAQSAADEGDNAKLGDETNSPVISAENTDGSSQSADSNMDGETKTLPETKPEKKTEEVVYDTVTTTLSQLSRKHYGSYHFWVYIYDENKDVIENPDLVEPGTRLRIPSREKYGIDYKNKESINNALKRAQEIANSFKR